MRKGGWEKWITENISAVFIALIEQGDLIVEETEPSKWREAGYAIYDKIKKSVSKEEKDTIEDKDDN